VHERNTEDLLGRQYYNVTGQNLKIEQAAMKQPTLGLRVVEDKARQEWVQVAQDMLLYLTYRNLLCCS